MSDTLTIRVWALSHQAHKHIKTRRYEEYINVRVFHWSLLLINHNIDGYRLVLLFINGHLINRRTMTITHQHINMNTSTAQNHQRDFPTPHATARFATRTSTVSRGCQAISVHLPWTISKTYTSPPQWPIIIVFTAWLLHVYGDVIPPRSHRVLTAFQVTSPNFGVCFEHAQNKRRDSHVTFDVYIQVWRAYWWLFCFGCCLRRVTCGSLDDACMVRGRCWYCHLASASLCGTLESGRLI